MIIDKFKRLLRTDFEQQFQSMIDKLAFSLNNTIESLVNAFNGNISLKENMLCTVKTLNIQVDSTGHPINTTTFQMSIPNKPIGVICINVNNLSNSTHYNVSGITVYWSVSGNTVTLNNITGLNASETYQLTLVAFG